MKDLLRKIIMPVVKPIVRLLMPSAKTLAEMAADEIASRINECGKSETIADYMKMGGKISAEARAFCSYLEDDGKIDTNEKAEVAKKLEPLFQRALDLL